MFQLASIMLRVTLLILLISCYPVATRSTIDYRSIDHKGIETPTAFQYVVASNHRETFSGEQNRDEGYFADQPHEPYAGNPKNHDQNDRFVERSTIDPNSGNRYYYVVKSDERKTHYFDRTDQRDGSTNGYPAPLTESYQPDRPTNQYAIDHSTQYYQYVADQPKMIPLDTRKSLKTSKSSEKSPESSGKSSGSREKSPSPEILSMGDCLQFYNDMHDIYHLPADQIVQKSRGQRSLRTGQWSNPMQRHQRDRVAAPGKPEIKKMALQKLSTAELYDLYLQKFASVLEIV